MWRGRSFLYLPLSEVIKKCDKTDGRDGWCPVIYLYNLYFRFHQTPPSLPPSLLSPWTTIKSSCQKSKIELNGVLSLLYLFRPLRFNLLSSEYLDLDFDWFTYWAQRSSLRWNCIVIPGSRLAGNKRVIPHCPLPRDWSVNKHIAFLTLPSGDHLAMAPWHHGTMSSDLCPDWLTC